MRFARLLVLVPAILLISTPVLPGHNWSSVSVIPDPDRGHVFQNPVNPSPDRSSGSGILDPDLESLSVFQNPAPDSSNVARRPAPVPKTVSQFLRMSSKDTTLCLLKGVVTRIRNNETGVLFINDGTGTVLIYRMRHRDHITFRHLDVRKGDTLTVSGHRSVYDGRVIEMKYALFEEKTNGPDHDKMPVMDELDKQPTFHGKGKEEFSKWVSAHLVYPEDAKKAHIDGTVTVKFVVGKNGGVQEVEVVKGAYPSLNEEAVRVIKSSPKWKPGIVDGHPVRVILIVPVVFTGDF